MQDNNEVQKAPAAPRREWVTPELRSLDLSKTLNGPDVTTHEIVLWNQTTGQIIPVSGPLS